MDQLEKRVELLVKDLPEKKKRFVELEAQSLDPNLWDDHNRARGIMQELGELKGEIENLENIEEEAAIALELGDEIEVERVEGKLTKLELAAYLSDKYDRKDAIVSIHAGQGGTEAMDWVKMLFRMYMRYIESRGWKLTVASETPGEEAGIKNITFLVSGQYAYGYLKNESGTHRLVRQSPFNADKLRQTSFALVEVLPEFEEIDLPDVQVKDEDLEWQFFRSTGAGGQNVNKVSTAVRLTYKPANIIITMQTQRTQEQNRKNALSLLRAKLWEQEQQKKEEERQKLAGEHKPATWGTQIRSYILHPYKMVKDLRTNVETSDTDAVLDGNIGEFVEAELKL